MQLPIKAALLGAGNRGFHIYGKYALHNKDKLNFVAVAEPIDTRRENFAKLHNIPLNRCYKSWEDLLAEEKFADVIFVCTQDQMHAQPTLNALEKGYHVLLEKPMATNLKDCIRIVKKVESSDLILGVCHVLRYTHFFLTIYKLIQEGYLGKVINISHRENVSWYHMAHSFVRGPWRSIKESSPMILAKCCHDLDLLYYMVGCLPKRISSFGSLTHFKSENAPIRAPKYCLDGCPEKDSCLYYAPRIYIDIIPIVQIMLKGHKKFFRLIAKLRQNHIKFLTFLSKLIPPLKRLRYWQEWPVNYLYVGQREDYSDKAKIEILKRSPYGRCVYACDNDVVDHQIVNIEFENRTTANLIMHGFSEKEGRTLRIDGTKGTLIGEFFDAYKRIIFYDHYTGNEEIIMDEKLSLSTVEHGGGDTLLIDAFINSLTGIYKHQPLTNPRDTLQSHLMAFAAHESRLNNRVIDMKEYRENVEKL
jgi:predicted dehydrogenase